MNEQMLLCLNMNTKHWSTTLRQNTVSVKFTSDLKLMACHSLPQCNTLHPPVVTSATFIAYLHHEPLNFTLHTSPGKSESCRLHVTSEPCPWHIRATSEPCRLDATSLGTSFPSQPAQSTAPKPGRSALTSHDILGSEIAGHGFLSIVVAHWLPTRLISSAVSRTGWMYLDLTPTGPADISSFFFF